MVYYVEDWGKEDLHRMCFARRMGGLNPSKPSSRSLVFGRQDETI
jgi:hypothetical protein